jgi:hypothetical protein
LMDTSDTLLWSGKVFDDEADARLPRVSGLAYRPCGIGSTAAASARSTIHPRGGRRT